MQPGEGALDHPARAAEAAALRRAALGELRGDAALPEPVSMRLRIVAAVALHELRCAHRPTGAPAERRHRIDQRQQLGHVVPVRRGQRRDERNPVRVSET